MHRIAHSIISYYKLGRRKTQEGNAKIQGSLTKTGKIEFSVKNWAALLFAMQTDRSDADT